MLLLLISLHSVTATGGSGASHEFDVQDAKATAQDQWDSYDFGDTAAWTATGVAGARRKRLRNAKKKAMAAAGVPTGRQAGSLFFGNISEWGPQSRAYVTGELQDSRAAASPEGVSETRGDGREGVIPEGNLEGMFATGNGGGAIPNPESGTKWEAMAFAELHLKGKKLLAAKRLFSSLGYNFGATTARDSTRTTTGTSGGVGIATPRHHNATTRDSHTKVQDDLPRLYGDDWCITILHRRGIDFAYATVYMECGGATTRNMKRALELGAALRALNIPFTIAGDWNATPEEADL